MERTQRGGVVRENNYSGSLVEGSFGGRWFRPESEGPLGLDSDYLLWSTGHSSTPIYVVTKGPSLESEDRISLRFILLSMLEKTRKEVLYKSRRGKRGIHLK